MRASASAAVPASPTTSMPSAPAEQRPDAVAHDLVVVEQEDPDRAVVSRHGRHRRRPGRRAPRERSCRRRVALTTSQRAAERARPVARGWRARCGAPRLGRIPTPSSRTREHDLVGHRQRHVRRARPGRAGSRSRPPRGRTASEVRRDLGRDARCRPGRRRRPGARSRCARRTRATRSRISAAQADLRRASRG